MHDSINGTGSPLRSKNAPNYSTEPKVKYYSTKNPLTLPQLYKVTTGIQYNKINATVITL